MRATIAAAVALIADVMVVGCHRKTSDAVTRLLGVGKIGSIRLEKWTPSVRPERWCRSVRPEG